MMYAVTLTLKIDAPDPESAVKQLREHLPATSIQEIKIKPSKGKG